RSRGRNSRRATARSSVGAPSLQPVRSFRAYCLRAFEETARRKEKNRRNRDFIRPSRGRRGSRTSLRQRRAAGLHAQNKRRRFRLLRYRRKENPRRDAIASNQAAGDSTGLHERLDLADAERPHPGDGPRRAREETVSLSRTVAGSAGRKQIRSHVRLRQGPAETTAARESRSEAPRSAARESAGDGRAVARADLYPDRQRRVRKRKQIFWPNDHAESSRRRHRDEVEVQVSRQERQGTRSRCDRSAPGEDHPAAPGPSRP